MVIDVFVLAEKDDFFAKISAIDLFYVTCFTDNKTIRVTHRLA